MKTTSAGLLTHFGSECTTLAVLWRVERTDGTVLGFTTHDQDLILGGVTHLASTGYTTSATDNNSDLSVDNLEVTGFLDSPSLDENDIRTGVYDNAIVTQTIVNWSDLTQGEMIIRQGRIGNVAMKNGIFQAEVRGLAQKLTTNVGSTYGPICRAELFSGPAQGAIPEPLGTVHAVGTTSQVVAAVFSQDPTGLIWAVGDGWNQNLLYRIDTVANRMLTYSPSDVTEGNTAYGAASNWLAFQQPNQIAGPYLYFYDGWLHEVTRVEPPFIIAATGVKWGGFSAPDAMYDACDLKILQHSNGKAYCAMLQFNRGMVAVFDLSDRSGGTATTSPLKGWAYFHADNTTSYPYDYAGSVVIDGDYFWVVTANSNTKQVYAIRFDPSQSVLAGGDATNYFPTVDRYTVFDDSTTLAGCRLAAFDPLSRNIVVGFDYGAGTADAFSGFMTAWNVDSHTQQAQSAYLSFDYEPMDYAVQAFNTLQVVDGFLYVLNFAAPASGPNVANETTLQKISCADLSVAATYDLTLYTPPFTVDTTSPIEETWFDKITGRLYMMWGDTTNYGYGSPLMSVQLALPSGITNQGIGPWFCRLVRSNYEQTGSIASATDSRTMVPNAGLVMKGSATPSTAAPTGWFSDGIITFTSGLNNGRTYEIKSWDGTTLTTFLPMAYVPLAGDTFKIEPGCDHTIGTCFTKFNNVINFRGEPNIPGMDQILNYPDAHLQQ